MFTKRSFFKFISLSVIFLSIMSCSQLSSKTSTEEIYIPYASQNELDEVKSLSEDYVDYKISRKLGMLEIANFIDFAAWSSDVTLSEYPVLILQSEKIPLYYEFQVLDGGELSGYITCNAKKKNGDPVAFVSADKKIYSKETGRVVKNSSCKIYAANYPATICQLLSRSATTNENLTEKTEEEVFYEWIESLTEEDFLELETTKEAALAEYEESKADEDNSAKQKNAYYFLEPYASNARKKTFDYCVPSVIEFFAKNYRDDNEVDITDKKIEETIEEKMGDTGIFMLSPKWKNTVETVTLNNVTVDSFLFHDFNKIKNNLIKNELPVISNRSGGRSVFGIFKEGHCRLVTGVCERQNLVAKQFLWIKWNKWEKTGYYYMWDNSYDFTNSPTTGETEYSIYKNKENGHFWEKDGTWFYLGSKALVKNIIEE